VPSGKIAVQAPPEMSPADGISTLLSSMVPMLGGVGAVVMVTMSGTGITGILTGGMFLLSSVGFVAVNGWRQRAQRMSQILSARREYLVYLAELRKTVRTAAKQQRRAALWRDPEPSSLLFLAEERTRVWERSPGAPDFLDIRIGTADEPLCVTLVAPELPPLAQLDPVAASAAHRFMVTHEMQRGLPHTIALDDYSFVEVVGEEDQVRETARAMLLQLATHHSPEDLQIAVLTDPASFGEWDWTKWIPHTASPRVNDEFGPARMIATSLAELQPLLPADIIDRPRFARGGGNGSLPHLVILIDGVRISASSVLIAAEGVQGVTIIELPANWDELEDPNRLRLAFTAGGGLAQRAANLEIVQVDGPSTHVLADTISLVEVEATARRLAPLYGAAGGEDDEAQKSTSSELVDILGVGDIREIDFDVQWQLRLKRDRLRVPIGLTTDGMPIALDLKESAEQGMGPHGVMIGATGSGKSEVLRTLVLALAITHSPDQLNFVLVDFKGGATFAGMAGMPHVSAIITNLGEELTLVDRMQEALAGEMTRRQELLRAAGNFANVTDYEKARLDNRPDLAPLPALVIVADEFSELLAAKPEFVDTFVNIGRLGRSLHVHLLLASQRLEEGKLRGLDSHLSYRIGLRTFSAAESRAVLGVPDAYDLPSSPGVGYLKPGTTSLIQFRASYVSGPPKPRLTIASGEPNNDANEKRSTFEIAVERMRGRGPQAHAVWLEPLVTPPTFDQLMPDLAVDPELGLISKTWRDAGELVAPLGVVDRPLEQRRENLVVSLSGAGGHMAIVGGPLSGKSTVARSLVVSLSLTRSPKEVQFYVLDFGGGTFVSLKNFPHVAGIASRSEPDVIRRMIAEVTGILNKREEYFRANGVDSIETYRQWRAAGRVDDGYGDVFLIVDGWATLRADFEDFERDIQAIAARGLTFGVHIVITLGRWLELRAGIKDLIGTRLELRLGDSTDSEINRKAAGNVPTGAPGRGLNAEGFHMLTALPRIDGDQQSSSLSAGIENLTARVTEAWKGEPGPKLRLLPKLITLDEVRAIAPPETRKLWLGVDEGNLAPIGIDPKAEPHLFLYGDSGSGKSSMLRSYAKEITRLYGPKEAKIFVLDYRRALLGEIPEEYVGSYLTTHDAALSGVSELAAFFRSRLPGKDVTPEQLRNRTWWTGAEGFLLIDDYDLVATSQGNPLLSIVPMLAQAADVGLHVVVTRRAGGASRASYDPVLQAMTDLGTTGILLSGNPEEGQLIGKVRAVKSAPGRAQIVSRELGVVGAQLSFSPSKY
jgi:S-DNA-T family DNA segregation ATPase FtsK/SpoIIIE